MARPRLELQLLLSQIPGVERVYFQSPHNTQMVYPCIVYDRDGADTKYADDRPYHVTYRYTVTVISRDPDNAIFQKIAELPLCSFNRSFPADDLIHDVFVLYF